MLFLDRYAPAVPYTVAMSLGHRGFGEIFFGVDGEGEKGWDGETPTQQGEMAQHGVCFP